LRIKYKGIIEDKAVEPPISAEHRLECARLC
jgi:hypothetical protein